MHEASRLLTNVMNVNGPMHDPCGMPAFINSESDSTSPILTRWRRWRKNEHVHLMTSGSPNSVNLAIRTLWSTRSNVLCPYYNWDKMFQLKHFISVVIRALAKSTKTTRTDRPSSTALHQWCIMSTSAWVAVSRLFSAPYWRTSSLSWILDPVQNPYANERFQ